MVKMKPHPVLGIMVRSDGMVLLPPRYKYGTEYWTRGCTWAGGYKVVVYRKKRYKVHRLVAETFIDNIDNLPYVDHIDRNPSNNDISNLRWATYRLNVLNRDDIIKARERIGLSMMTDTDIVRKARCKEWYRSEAGQKYYKRKYEKFKENKCA